MFIQVRRPFFGSKNVLRHEDCIGYIPKEDKYCGFLSRDCTINHYSIINITAKPVPAVNSIKQLLAFKGRKFVGPNVCYVIKWTFIKQAPSNVILLLSWQTLDRFDRIRNNA